MKGLLASVAFAIALLNATAQDIEKLTFEALQTKIESKSDDLRIFNFWATWCKPCIQEMPHFEAADSRVGVDVTFISLDFAEELDSKVIPFVKKKRIKSEVVLLDDIDYNSWINRIDKNWSGAIPATLFITAGGERYFHEGQLSESELDDVISNMN
jgi:thiol-disulfide isomerase/thioredoxin